MSLSPRSPFQTDRDLSWGQGLCAGVRQRRRRLKIGREEVLTTAELLSEWDPTLQEGRVGLIFLMPMTDQAMSEFTLEESKPSQIMTLSCTEP